MCLACVAGWQVELTSELYRVHEVSVQLYLIVVIRDNLWVANHIRRVRWVERL